MTTRTRPPPSIRMLGRWSGGQYSAFEMTAIVSVIKSTSIFNGYIDHNILVFSILDGAMTIVYSQRDGRRCQQS